MLCYTPASARRACPPRGGSPDSVITRRRFLQLGSIGFAGTVGVARTGLAEAADLPGLSHPTLVLPHLPHDLDGLVVAQVSDVHAGPYMGIAKMRRIRDLVMAVDPDLIVFTGDQVDRRDTDADLFAAGFRGIAAPLGVYGILGNHDHYIDPRRSEWALQAAGVTPLVNRGVVVNRGGSRLALVGVEDLTARPGRSADFAVLRRFPDAFRVCLTHQPQSWNEALAHGAHLTLSGHTHGGQIALPTRNVNVARLHTRFIAGPYRREDALLYVSRGIGVGAVPLRLGAPPEIDVLTLRRGSDAQAVAA